MYKTLIAVALVLFNSVGAAFGCATCGCSEVAPVTMMDSGPGVNGGGLLSDSIWGNMILKMAYQHDPQLQRLTKHKKTANGATTAAFATVATGTLSQSISSLATLNPNEDLGLQDSYTPGIIGLALSSCTIMTFGARAALGHTFKTKIQKRQTEIRGLVETVLRHLEYSKTDCSEAQLELADLIGDKAAGECVQLWRSSHQLASAPDTTM